MKTFALKNSPTQNSVLEHTPIHDLDAYLMQKRSQQKLKLLKRAFESGVISIIVDLTFSIISGR
ncbi:hypothetical protein [Acinetobacter calcoaceticus]|uniref:hypothetical protein n=1 Tax=Acinetobacter calcoaceticus TaxID=471 RepID=UPI0002CE17C6|nr:hypothetical protein [Acinetobacter calcoaceticus]ENU11071.1 hypothetical protein F997_00076 [Acinetobacter calcoaceticus NIPH 13]